MCSAWPCTLLRPPEVQRRQAPSAGGPRGCVAVGSGGSLARILRISVWRQPSAPSGLKAGSEIPRREREREKRGKLKRMTGDSVRSGSRIGYSVWRRPEAGGRQDPWGGAEGMPTAGGRIHAGAFAGRDGTAQGKKTSNYYFPLISDISG